MVRGGVHVHSDAAQRALVDQLPSLLLHPLQISSTIIQGTLMRCGGSIGSGGRGSSRWGVVVISSTVIIAVNSQVFVVAVDS